MEVPILVTGAAGRVGAIGRTVTELLLKQSKAVHAMVRNEDKRAQVLRDMGAEWSVEALKRPTLDKRPHFVERCRRRAC